MKVRMGEEGGFYNSPEDESLFFLFLFFFPSPLSARSLIASAEDSGRI